MPRSPMTAPRKAPVTPDPSRTENPRTTAFRLLTPTFGVLDGIGAVAERAALAIEAAGARVVLEGSPNDATYGTTFTYQGTAPDAPIIDFFSPECWADPTQRRIGIALGDRSVAPQSWENGLRHAAAVLCPSVWMLEAVRPYAPEAKLARFGVDDAFSYAPRKRGSVLTFGMALARGQEYRKGVDVAIAAFAKAFPGRDDVELVLRSAFPLDVQKDDSRIRFEIGRKTTADLAVWYRSLDALVHPARCEAFAAVPLEAMACGTPALHTGKTGLSDIERLGLTFASRPLSPAIGDVTEWAEPDADDLAERMREVDTMYAAVRLRAEQDAQALRTRFSWGVFAEKITRLL